MRLRYPDDRGSLSLLTALGVPVLFFTLILLLEPLILLNRRLTGLQERLNRSASLLMVASRLSAEELDTPPANGIYSERTPVPVEVEVRSAGGEGYELLLRAGRGSERMSLTLYLEEHQE